jgi:hypothetical protein
LKNPPRANSKKMSKPKRNISAYLFFLQSERAAFKKANTTGEKMKMKSFMKQSATKWADLKDRKEFEDKAGKDAERYAKEMESYTPAPEDAKAKPAGTDITRGLLFEINWREILTKRYL